MSDQRGIDQLPPELLAVIFGFVFHPAPWDRHFLQAFNHLITVTHVCHYWRVVARGTPLLWTTIRHSKTRTPQFWIRLLQLSQTLPLHVSLSDTASEFIETLYGDHTHRISTLEVMMGRCTIDESCCYTLPQDLSWPAPQLQTLLISHSRSDDEDPPHYHVQPHLLFSDYAPQLSKLVISGMPWLPANHFNNLVQMHIAGPAALEWDFLKDFLGMLSRSPRLEELYLTAFNHEVSVASNLPVVTLPRLRRLCLENPLSDSVVGDLLSHINLPDNNIALQVSDIYGKFDPIDFIVLFPQMNFMHSLTALRLSNCDQSSLIATGPSCGLYIRLDEVEPPELMHVLQHQYDTLKELWLDESLIEDLSILFAILKPLTGLETIVIVEGESEGWLPAVVAVLRQALGAPSLCCRCLSILRLWLHRSPLPAGLVVLAAERARQGCPLETFLIEDFEVANVRLTDVELLRDLRRSVETVTRRIGYQPTMPLPEMCTRAGQFDDFCSWRPWSMVL